MNRPRDRQWRHQDIKEREYMDNHGTYLIWDLQAPYSPFVAPKKTEYEECEFDESTFEELDVGFNQDKIRKVRKGKTRI